MVYKNGGMPNATGNLKSVYSQSNVDTFTVPYTLTSKGKLTLHFSKLGTIRTRKLPNISPTTIVQFAFDKNHGLPLNLYSKSYNTSRTIIGTAKDDRGRINENLYVAIESFYIGNATYGAKIYVTGTVNNYELNLNFTKDISYNLIIRDFEVDIPN